MLPFYNYKPAPNEDATVERRGLMPAALVKKLAQLTFSSGNKLALGNMPAGLVMATHVRPVFGIAGNTTYTNATTGWTKIGGTMANGPGVGLPAALTGTVRRFHWLTSYSHTVNSGQALIWFMSGGAPGTGVTQYTISCDYTAGIPADATQMQRSAYYTGTPYSGGGLDMYGQSTTGSTFRVLSVVLVVEDITP